MRALKEIIVHCTATVEGKDYTVADVRGWHKARGWNDIGYHFLIDLAGKVHVGRPLEQVGSHVAGRNTGTIGIAYVGGVDAKMNPKDTRTAAQKVALETLIRDLLAKHRGINMISGHRDYAAKACPCFDARAEYAPLLTRDGKPAPSLPSMSDGSALAAIGMGVVATKSGNLNLRRTPGGEVIGPMPKGTAVVVYGAEGDWLNVQTPFGARGYASRDLIKIAA